MSKESTEEPIKLEDAIENMIDFCFQVIEVSETGISGDNPTKKRINKFKILFEQKRDKPNNLKKHVEIIYLKTKNEIFKLNVGDDLSTDIDNVKKFLVWFSEQSLSIQPRENEKSVSIPLSIICRDCLKVSKLDEEKEDIDLLFALLLLRILAFSTDEKEEEKIDQIIAYLENILDVSPNECPDVANFFFHLMDKVTGKYGGKEASQQIKKIMKGKMKREDRQKYEDIIMNVADGILSKMPKDGNMTNPADIQASFMDMTKELSKNGAIPEDMFRNISLPEDMFKDSSLPDGISEAMNAVSIDKD